MPVLICVSVLRYPCISFVRCIPFWSLPQISSQMPRHSVQKPLLWRSLHCGCHLNLLWCSVTGNKTGGASPSCGLMQYYIGFAVAARQCPVIRAFDNRAEAGTQLVLRLRSCNSGEREKWKSVGGITQHVSSDTHFRECNVEICDCLWSWRRRLRGQRKESMSGLEWLPYFLWSAVYCWLRAQAHSEPRLPLLFIGSSSLDWLSVSWCW